MLTKTSTEWIAGKTFIKRSRRSSVADIWWSTGRRRKFLTSGSAAARRDVTKALVSIGEKQIRTIVPVVAKNYNVTAHTWKISGAEITLIFESHSNVRTWIIFDRYDESASLIIQNCGRYLVAILCLLLAVFPCSVLRAMHVKIALEVRLWTSAKIFH